MSAGSRANNLCDAEYFSNWAVAHTDRNEETYVSIIYAHYEMYVRRQGGVPVCVNDFGSLLKFFGVKKPKRDKHGRRVLLSLKHTPEQERRAAAKAFQEQQTAAKAARRLRKLLP